MVEGAGRRLSWRRLLTSNKYTLLWPVLVVSLFFIFLNSKMRYIVEEPNYRRFWQPANTVSPSGGVTSYPLDETTPSMGVCAPRTNAVFLKTHKCAGSTVQNVFMRFGDQRNLTFVLPRKGNYLGHPEPFNGRFMPDARKYNVTYNLLCHHNRFHYENTVNLMPNDTVYVTILREPVDLFESMYSYYGLFSFYKLPLERLGLSRARSPPLLRRRSLNKFGINQMLFDLGFDPLNFDNETAVNKYVNRLDKIFSLVMIADRMDESLILLKDLMCWQLSDMVVFKLNARNSRFKTKLSASARSRLKTLNSADALLYRHFLDKLDKQIEAFGRDRMAEELSELQKETDFWYHQCVKKQDLLKRIKTPHQQEANPRVMAFLPNNDSNSTCWALTIPELEFTDHLRAKQTFYTAEAALEAKSKAVRNKAVVKAAKNLLKKG